MAAVGYCVDFCLALQDKRKLLTLQNFPAQDRTQLGEQTQAQL